MKLAVNIGGQPVNLPKSITSLSKLTSNDYGTSILQTTVNLMFIFAIILSLFFMIYGGIKWTTSEGDPKKVEGARNTILYAALGLALAFLSIFIVNVIGAFLGVPLLGGK